MIFRVPIVVICVATGLSCQTEPEDTFKTTGVIAYRSDVFSGDFNGFYYIAGDDGKEYYPVNLPNDFQHEQSRVRFEAREIQYGKPLAGWGNGPVIELIHIQKISS